jgi:hypothetical protein
VKVTRFYECLFLAIGAKMNIFMRAPCALVVNRLSGEFFSAQLHFLHTCLKEAYHG